jgi:RNA recognition motif-containing protein
MAAKLFVGNLSFQATEEDLRELFAQAGTVETVRIITDQFTGRPRGFGFVEMATKEEATKAVEMLNGRLFRDRNLVVDEARPQPQRGAGGGGGPRGDRGGRPGGGPGGGAAVVVGAAEIAARRGIVRGPGRPPRAFEFY